MKKKIIIDCDPGHDDTMAIIYALANQEFFDILGVCTVSGNQSIEKVNHNVKRLYSYLGMSTPFAFGATRSLLREVQVGADVHGETGLDGWNFGEIKVQEEKMHAVEFMAKCLRESSQKVTLVPIGPLTNIALLIRMYPELINKIEQISLMGGSIYSGNVTARAEFNFFVDPEAAYIVYHSGIPILMSGLDVTEKAGINDQEIEELRKSDGPVSKMVGELLTFYTRYHRKRGYEIYPIHDLCAVMALQHPEIFKGEDLMVDISLSDDLHRGTSSADIREWNTNKVPNAHVLFEVERGPFIEYFIKSIRKLDVEFEKIHKK